MTIHLYEELFFGIIVPAVLTLSVHPHYYSTIIVDYFCRHKELTFLLTISGESFLLTILITFLITFFVDTFANNFS